MIDYSLLADAQNFYNERGFKYIETPWNVKKEVIESTFLIDESHRFYLKNSDSFLVGSGEQGFLDLILSGKLDFGSYQTTTPCFRDEPIIDQFHQFHFMKNELIIYDQDINFLKLHSLITDAEMFFSRYLDGNLAIEKMGDNQYDIFCDNIELGSYGIGEYQDKKWIYGTGCAEPRLSTVINMYK